MKHLQYSEKGATTKLRNVRGFNKRRLFEYEDFSSEGLQLRYTSVQMIRNIDIVGANGL